MLGVLQVVFSQHAIPGRKSVPGELLIALIDVLGVTPNLYALGAVGFERAVRIIAAAPVSATAAATAAAGLPVAAALPFHAPEISHGYQRLGLARAPVAWRCGSGRQG